MLIDIRLRQFRSYLDESFEFNQAVTIIVGSNASGKTNLLESILVISRGSSYRATDGDLLMFDRPWARIDARFEDEERSLKLTPSEKLKKQFIINDKTYQRLPSQRTVPTVLFEPNHLRMLAGSPERRRSYIDELLSQIKPTYAANLRRYRKVLAQRNALLKQRHTSNLTQQLFPWNIKLCQLAGMIATERIELLDDLNANIKKLYQTLSASGTEISLRYDGTCTQSQYETDMIHKLEKNLQLDLERGFTGVGPHRDDIAILFDGRLSGLTASRGETRTAILALKILELQMLERVRDTKPLLLLDDVYSELDGARRHALTEYISNYQTFITTTDADVALANFGDNCAVIPLQS